MMYTTTDLSLNSKKTNSLPALLERIENKIFTMGRLAYETTAYGIDHKDISIEDLLMYREIIVQKINGCGCIDAVPMTKIISKINKLTQ